MDVERNAKIIVALCVFALAPSAFAEPVTAPAAAMLASAPSNAALSALPHTAYPAVLRIGFAAPGNSPPLLMIPSAAPCPLHGGLGDGGSQIPTRDGGCWRARFAGYEPDPTDWGAPNDGDDASDQVQAAIDALAGDVLYTHANLFTLARGVTDRTTRIVGVRSKATGGFRAGAANLNLLTLSGDNVEADGLFIDMRGPGANTSGAAVVLASPGNGRVHDLFIEQPCAGIDIEGGTRNTADDNWINDVTGAACAGVVVGRTSRGGGTVDPIVIHNTIGGKAGAPGGFAVEVFDAGGLHQTGNTVLGTLVGTALTPGAGQYVEWGFFQGELGDTNGDVALLIDPTAPSGVVKGVSFTQVWAASAANQDILIENTGRGVVAGLHFDGARIYAAGRDGVEIDAGTDISFDASAVCGPSRSAPGVYADIALAGGLSRIAIRGSEIGGGCDGDANSGAPLAGVRLAGPTTAITITGDDFSAAAGSGGAISGPLPTDLGSRICANTGYTVPRTSNRSGGCDP